MINKVRTFFGFLDLLFQMLFILMILPHNPEVDAKADQPGTLAVEIAWPDEINTDIDLWVLAPGDKPVGYQNRAGLVFNLLRDDMGKINDPLEINYENAFTRGTPAGEYIVNVHLYSNVDQVTDIPVNVRVFLKPEDINSTLTVYTGRVILRHIGQEITAIRFSIDEAGHVIKDSFHDLPRRLKTIADTGEH